MNIDDLLHSAVREEAERVHPGPEGWDRIREGVRARRRRTAWLRGGIAAAAALSVVGLASAVVLRDGRDAAIQPAQTPEPSPTRAPDVVMPATFAGIEGGRVAVLDSATGEVVRYLTDPQAGLSPWAPVLSADSVLYGVSDGTCSGRIMSVPITGGAPSQLVVSDDRVVSHPALGPGLAYFRTQCGETDAEDRVELVVEFETRTQRFPVDGPVRGGLSWLDGRFLVYVTETEDGRTTLHSVDSTGELADGNPAPDPGCQWHAATVRPGARPDGTSALVAYELCRAGVAGQQYGQLVMLDGNDLGRETLLRLDETAVQWLDYDASGRHLLIWRGGASVTGPIDYWSGTGDPRPFTQGPEFPTWN